MNRKRFWILLISFHALFFCKQLFFQNSMLQDSREYLFAADNLMQHQTLYARDINDTFNVNWLTRRPFLYPAILVVIKFLSFGSGELFFIILYLLQNLVSLLCIWLVLKTAGKYVSRINYTHAVLFLLLSVSQVIYTNLVMSEIWLQLCMVAIVHILLMYPLNTRHIIYIGLLLIAGMSLKPVLIFTIFCFPLYYVARSFRAIQFKHLALTLLPLCFYFSMCKINQERTGYFHYSSISNFNLLHYNAYSVLLNKYGTQKADSIVDQIKLDAQTQGDYAAQQNYIRKAASAQIGDHLALYTWLHVRGAMFCLMDPGRFDFTQFFNLPHTQNLVYETNKEGAFKNIVRSFLNPLGILLGCLMLFNLFKVYVMARFAFSKTIGLGIKLIILFFPLYILFFTGPIGSSRFYMPFIPLVLLMFLMTASGKEGNSAV